MASDKPTILFIGAGNMAEALIAGMLRQGLAEASSLLITDVSEERKAYMQAAYGVVAAPDNKTGAEKADLVVLAVKPQQLIDLLTELAPVITSRHVVVSIAAGIPLTVLEQAFPEARVIRTMPNTPALVGKGITALCGGARTTEDDLTLTARLLSGTGEVVRVAESDMDAVTAISGSGPAYVFYLMEAMLAAATKLGLDETTARSLVLNTVEGAAQLAIQSSETPEMLRQRVTSKGGTTAAATNVLDENQVHDHMVRAIEAAAQRAKELSAASTAS